MREIARPPAWAGQSALGLLFTALVVVVQMRSLEVRRHPLPPNPADIVTREVGPEPTQSEQEERPETLPTRTPSASTPSPTTVVVLPRTAPGRQATTPVASNGESTQFLYAVQDGRLEDVRAYLDRNPKAVNAPNDVGQPPLIAAVYSGRLDMVQLLLQHRADLRARATDGATALHYAATLPQPYIAQLLIQAGAELEARDGGQMTPLFSAGIHDSVAAASLLIQSGANVSAIGVEGFTPLIYAAQNGSGGVVQLLLNSGANPGARDRRGRTAADAAREKGHGELADLIERAGSAGQAGGAGGER